MRDLHDRRHHMLGLLAVELMIMPVAGVGGAREPILASGVRSQPVCRGRGARL